MCWSKLWEGRVSWFGQVGKFLSLLFLTKWAVSREGKETRRQGTVEVEDLEMYFFKTIHQHGQLRN